MHFVFCIHSGVTLCTLVAKIKKLSVFNTRGSLTFLHWQKSHNISDSMWISFCFYDVIFVLEYK